jgi:hypothetical protein
MIVIPVMAFYASYVFIFDWKEEGLAWSGFIAVAATNLVVAAYVVVAWNEDQEDMKAIRLEQEKEKQSDNNSIAQKSNKRKES